MFMKNICCFIGHSSIVYSDELSQRVEDAILQVIKEGVDTFYCGGYGDFDLLCAKVVNKLKSKYQNIKCIFVTPYINEGYKNKLKSVKDAGLYDEILYPPLELVLQRYAISERNKFMINASDRIIVYIKYDFGGAYTAFKYAVNKGKSIIKI